MTGNVCFVRSGVLARVYEDGQRHDIDPLEHEGLVIRTGDPKGLLPVYDEYVCVHCGCVYAQEEDYGRKPR